MSSKFLAVPTPDFKPGDLRRRATDRPLSPRTVREPEVGAASDNERLAKKNALEDSRSPGLARKKLPWLEDKLKAAPEGDPGYTAKDDAQHVPKTAQSTTLCAQPEILNKKTVSRSNDAPATCNLHGPTPANGHRPNTNIEVIPLSPSADTVTPGYASSEYSGTVSSDPDPLPASLPKKSPASYEKLVRHDSKPRVSRFHENNDSSQSELDLPRGNSDLRQKEKLKGTTKPKPISELRQQQAHHRMRQRCPSCDAAGEPSELLNARGVHSSRAPVVLNDEDEVTNLLRGASLALRRASSANKNMTPLPPPESARFPHVEQRDLSSEERSPRARMSSKNVRSGRDLKKIISTPRPEILTRVHIASPLDPTSFTPPRLYHPISTDSIVRDFAYTEKPKTRRRSAPTVDNRNYHGLAADYYNDQGESVGFQPGVRPSISSYNKQLPKVPDPEQYQGHSILGRHERVHRAHHLRHPKRPLPGPMIRGISQTDAVAPDDETPSRRATNLAIPQALREKLDQDSSQVAPAEATEVSPTFMQSAYYRDDATNLNKSSGESTNTSGQPPQLIFSKNLSLKHPRRTHISLGENEGFSFTRYHRRQPIAREWSVKRKRFTAMIACLNTIFIGLIAGIYAGEVPRIQYQLADDSHWVIFGNTLFFACMAISTIIFWPLPLLHGRKPYTLVAFGLMLPLHIPQAITVSSYHQPGTVFKLGLLIPRALTGLALGFANINILPTLLDLFGASLMSERPHQEYVAYDDVRRQGGGIGVWLGIWTFCFSSSLSIGFCAGALIIYKLDPSWGFWIITILLAFFLLLNVIAPETRKSAFRQSIHHFYEDGDVEKVRRRVARGEVKLHISNEGPKFWWEEVWAGMILTKRMVLQPGFCVLMVYLAWINAQLTLIILLLGALLSRDYKWPSYSIGLAALAVPIGAAIALPLTKASWLSRARSTPPRTDSMTMKPKRFTYSSHLVRRIIFSSLLPLAGLGYCLTARGPPMHWSACVIFSGFVGFLTDLGVAECIGLIMETFDTCDLQPGVNTKHRLQSLSAATKRRRTSYSCFPRVCAGFFAAQSLGFMLTAGATVIAGRVTDSYGTQTAMSIVAGILAAVTVVFFLVVWRWKEVQVIPSFTSGEGKDSEWKAVVIGKPSGKMRRMNLLELGWWSRWGEVRRLNRLVRE